MQHTPVPILAGIDTLFHRFLCCWLDRKGVESVYAFKTVQGFMKSLGFKRGCLQTDPENAARSVAASAVRDFDGWVVRTTPRGSKGAN
eukprot:2287434-Amphidinium_carterae.1